MKILLRILAILPYIVIFGGLLCWLGIIVGFWWVMGGTLFVLWFIWSISYMGG